MSILIVVARSEHTKFIMTALRGAFQSAAILEDKATAATAQLIKQGITVLTQVPMEQALRVKAHLVIFPHGCDEPEKKNWLVWKPKGVVEERDRIVDEAIRVLVKRKLLKPL